MTGNDDARPDVAPAGDIVVAVQNVSEAGRVVRAASRVSPRLVAASCAAAIAVFVAMGIAQRTVVPEWGAANLDSEVSIATRFSAALLWAAAFWWLLVAVRARTKRAVLWLWWPVLAWLALDEGAAIHEKLERWSGVDWQLLYLPVAAFGALAWLGVVDRFRRRPRIVALLGIAAAAWIAALSLELVQNWGGSPVQAAVYVPTMIIEEALEMVGSAALLVAAILALRGLVGASLRRA